MKPQRQIPAIVLLALLVGCAQTQPGSDPVVVNAERTVTIAKATFQFAVDTESQSRASLMQIDPKAAIQIKHGVDYIRANAQSWQAASVNCIKAYKTNANNANLSTLQKALADLVAGMSQAQNAINHIQQVKGGTP